MIKELGWYLESGRFSNLVVELEDSLKQYETAKKEGLEENALSPLRENARLLFEDHCVRSGLRESENSFINIDAEFFTGNALDEEAVNSFIKNIIKGHCYQKVLWTYMGTTGSFTAISKVEMANQGLRYEDYLPLEYKKNLHVKKPLENKEGKDNELFYMYGDGTISKEYLPEKAKLKFNALEDNSGIDWNIGYDPNGAVKKDGWYGAYDYTGTWVRREEKEEYRAEPQTGSMVLELIKNGDNAVLYDPGMLLLSSPMLMYLTESGEPYGNLEMDRERMIHDIRSTLKTMGLTGIGAVGGIAPDNPKTIAAYTEVLKDLALPDLATMDTKTVISIKEAHEKDVIEKAAEVSGVELERKLRVAGKHGGDSKAIAAAITSGTMTAPLSPGKMSDGLALGLNEEEVKAISVIPVRPENEKMFNAALSNLYAAWAYYESSGLTRVEAARLVNESLEKETTLKKDVVRKYTERDSGRDSEPLEVDFYDVKARENFLKNLERQQKLPRGGAKAAMSALTKLPEVDEPKKAVLSGRLTRAMEQYKVISKDTSTSIEEVIELVTVDITRSENNNISPLLRTPVSSEGMVSGKGVVLQEYLSGIPEVYKESVIIDFYDGKASEKFLENLEKENVLPKGGAKAAIPVLAKLPETDEPKKAVLNRGLTRALGQYKTISKDTGLSVEEVIGLVAADINGSENNNVSPLIHTHIGLEGIVGGKGGGLQEYLSRIPGSYTDLVTIDFYNERISEKFLENLEKENVLPKGGAKAAMSALAKLPETDEPKKAVLNKGLTHALEQYKAIAKNTGLSVEELIETVKTEVGKTENINALPLVNTQANLEGIVGDKSVVLQEYPSRMPGSYAEPVTIDFYDRKTSESFLKNLEQQQKLPKGGTKAVMSALAKLPEADETKKAELNRGLTHALEQYKTIAKNTGLSIEGLIETVKTETGRTEKNHENTFPVINAQVSLGEIIYGKEDAVREGAQTYSSGIPGVFTDLSVIDFYDIKARESFLKGLERKRVLPKGGAVTAAKALENLPQGDEEKKAGLNRRLTRALGQYKAISMSTGMPIGELIEAAKIETPSGESNNQAVLNRKVYYELPTETLIEEAKKENYQTKEVKLEDEQERLGESDIIIGGHHGPALDEVMLTRETLIAGSLSTEEKEKAESFLHSIRFASESPVIPESLLAVMKRDDFTNAERLQESILGALDTHDGVAYNLSSKEGLTAYLGSKRTGYSGISKQDVQILLQEEMKNSAAIPVSSAVVSGITPHYRSDGKAVPFTRSAPKGTPEKIQLARSPLVEDNRSRIESQDGRQVADGPFFIFDTDNNDKANRVNAAELGGINEDVLKKEFGYTGREAIETVKYLQDITIPQGKEAYFINNLAPVFKKLLGETGEAKIFKGRVEDVFRKSTGVSSTLTKPITNNLPESAVFTIGNEKYSPTQTAISMYRGIPENGTIVPLESRPKSDEQVPVNEGFAGIPSDIVQSVMRKNTASNYVPKGNLGTDFGILQGNTRIGNSVERSGISQGARVAGISSVPQTESGYAFPAQSGRNAEIERLRRIEANYEKDKAVLAKEKVPALARSESHDVGHAANIENDEDLHKLARLRQKEVIDELRRRKGI